MLLRQLEAHQSFHTKQDLKLEAWQAIALPRLDCCTELTSKASGLTASLSVVYAKITSGNVV